MYNIKLLNKIAACGTSMFSDDKYNVGENVENPDAIMVRSAAMHDMEFGDELLAIARAGAGVNNIPIDRMLRKRNRRFQYTGSKRKRRKGTCSSRFASCFKKNS